MTTLYVDTYWMKKASFIFNNKKETYTHKRKLISCRCSGCCCYYTACTLGYIYISNRKKKEEFYVCMKLSLQFIHLIIY